MNFGKIIKLLLVGDSGVGKSSLLMTYDNEPFLEDGLPTIGVDFKIKKQKVNGENCVIQVWDTAGQERFRGITEQYYRGSHGIGIVYDITKHDSFINVETWLKDIRKICEDVPIILIGNKVDLDLKRTVSQKEAVSFALKHKLQFVETSAKTSKNVEDLFGDLVEKAFEHKTSLPEVNPPTIPNPVPVNQPSFLSKLCTIL